MADVGNGNFGVGGVTVMAGEPPVDAAGCACSCALGCAPVPKAGEGNAGILGALGWEVPLGWFNDPNGLLLGVALSAATFGLPKGLVFAANGFVTGAAVDDDDEAEPPC